MRRVIIQYDEVVKFFEKVTHVKVFNNGLFDSYIEIYQGKKKTKLDMTTIIGFEVRSD